MCYTNPISDITWPSTTIRLPMKSWHSVSTNTLNVDVSEKFTDVFVSLGCAPDEAAGMMTCDILRINKPLTPGNK